MKKEISPVHEGCWGWVIVASCFTIFVMSYGMGWTVGVFNAIFLDEFGSSSVVTAWTGALMTAMMYAAGPIAAMLINKYDSRNVTIVGGIISSAGLIMSFFAPNIYFLYFSYGIVTGFGFGISFLPPLTLISYYFERRRSLAIGIAVSGVGVGTFIYPPLIRWLLELYGWRGTLLIIAGITCNICVCGALLRPTTRTGVTNRRNISAWDTSCLRKVNYWMICLNNVTLCFGISVVYVHLSAYSESIGIDPTQSALLVSGLGLANVLGRLVYGILGQHPRTNCILTYAVSFVIAGIFVMCSPFVKTFIGFLSLSSMFGFFSGCFGTLLPSIIVQVLGLRRLANGYGYVLIFEALGTVVGGPFAGFLFDITRKYAASFYMGGAMIIASSFFLILPYWRLRDIKGEIEINIDDPCPVDQFTSLVSISGTNGMTASVTSIIDKDGRVKSVLSVADKNGCIHDKRLL